MKKTIKSNELSDLLEEYELEPKSNKELRIQSIERFLETNDSEEDIDSDMVYTEYTKKLDKVIKTGTKIKSCILVRYKIQ